MNKIICYGFENGKLWFGRVTLWSWLMAFFIDGRFLEVKPIKGYEEFAYYTEHCLITLPSWSKITNDWLCQDNPIIAIAQAEKKNPDFTIEPIHPEQKVKIGG